MKKTALILLALTLLTPVLFAQNGGLKNTYTVKNGQYKFNDKADLYQMYGDSLVNVSSKIERGIELQNEKNADNKARLANYDAFVGVFWQKLKDEKKLSSKVTFQDFKENYLIPVEVFKQLLPEYTAIENKGSVLSDDINKNGNYRLVAMIDGEYYSLNNLYKQKGYFLLQWSFGIIKDNLDRDGGFICQDSLDVLICTDQATNKNIKVTHWWTTKSDSHGLMSEFIKTRLADTNPQVGDTSWMVNTIKINSRALAAYAKILQKFELDF